MTQSAKAKLRLNQKPASKLLLLNCVLIVAVASMAVVDTLITNAQVAVGAQANSLFQQRQELANQVSQLRWQAAQNKSLQSIQDQATSQLGMEPINKNLLYLQSPYAATNHDQSQD